MNYQVELSDREGEEVTMNSHTALLYTESPALVSNSNLLIEEFCYDHIGYSIVKYCSWNLLLQEYKYTLYSERQITPCVWGEGDDPII